MISTDELIRSIQTVGFPIVVCVWFMLRTEKVITNNTTALNTNTTVLNNLVKKIK